MVFRVEEIGGPKVRVALALVRVDARYLNREVDRCISKVGFVADERSANVSKSALHRRNHQVPDGELDR
jgi:hypothetical protein